MYVPKGTTFLPSDMIPGYGLSNIDDIIAIQIKNLNLQINHRQQRSLGGSNSPLELVETKGIGTFASSC